jgi:hypothetical protein
VIPDAPRRELAWTLRSKSGTRALTKDDMVSEIDGLLACLSRIGVVVDRNSRLYKARDVIGKLARHEMPSETQLGSNAPRTILTIMRDVVQWSAIAHHWPNSDDPIYREKSIRLLKDAVSPPKVNSIPTPGRDIQFELFANACWNAAGTLTRLASPPAPDLLITTHPWFFGAEAKRIRGMNQVKIRAKEANKQLKYCPAGGLLFNRFIQSIRDSASASNNTGCNQRSGGTTL